MVQDDDRGDRTRPEPLPIEPVIARSPAPGHIGRFRLLGQLGAGGMGEVFSGHDPLLDRIVAIKRLRSDRVQTEEQRERLHREARASAKLSHPNIVTVYDLVHHDGADHIVTEYVDGRSLREMTAHGRPSLDRALEILAAVADGIRHAHEHREEIVHRDLKTENVLVGFDGSVKIADFGISHSLRRRVVDPASQTTGTLRAMSPEQSAGAATDARSDLFSFGTLIYEVVAGTSPFEGRSAEETLENIRSRPHRPLSDWAPEVPRELARLVDRLLEKNPLERPHGAAEVADALHRIIAGRKEARHAAGHRPSIDRRQVAIVHFRAVGLALVDHEERADRIAAFQRIVADATVAHRGHLVYAAGREALLCIGWPETHEHNGQRAAALVDEVSTRAAGGVRAALDIGDVFIVSLRAGPLLVGAPVDNASRLGRGADDAAFVIGMRAQPLLARHLRMAVKSIDSPTDAGGGPHYEVLGPRDEEPVGVLVGRARELAHLRTLWAATEGRRGIAIAITGEAGIGKTRMLRELVRTAAPQGRMVLAQAQVNTQLTPFAALRHALAELVGVAHEHDASRRRMAVHQCFAQLEDGDQDRLAALAQILDAAEARDEERLAAVAPRAKPSFLQEQLAAAFVRLATARPFTLVVEDLHWLDHSSLQVLDLLAARSADAPLALLVTHRSGWAHAWPTGTVVEVPLRGLSEADAGELVRRIAGARAIDPALERTIVHRGEGVPLVLEELTHAVLDGGSAGADRVPVSLADSIAVRLQRLGAGARGIVELAAVIGREPDPETLAAAADLAGAELADHLDTLVRKGLLERHGSGSERRWVFGHSLTRDAIYDSIERSRRIALHARVAAAIETSTTDPEMRTDLVAQHLEGAEQWSRALELWSRGARAATERSAWARARARWECALAIILRHGDPGPRREQERQIRESLAALLVTTEGWGAPVVERNAARVHELAAQSDQELPWTVLWQDWAMGYVTGNMAVMSAAFGRLDDRVLREPSDPQQAAERELIRYLLASARGAVYVHLGLLGKAREQLRMALELRGPLLPVLRSFPQVEPIIVPSSYLAWTHLYLGDLEEAWRVMRADEEDVELGDAARACARAFALAPASVTSDWHAVELRARRVIDEAPGVLAPQFVAVARLSLRLVELQRRARGPGAQDPGELEALLDGLWAHFEEWWQTGQMRASSPFYAALAGEVCVDVVRNPESAAACRPGALARGRRFVDWGLAELSAADNEIHRVYASEVHRVNAELLALEDRAAQSRAALDEARFCALWIGRNSGAPARWLEDRVAETARRLGFNSEPAVA